MCWFSKPRAAPDPPSADRLAVLVTKSPPMLAVNTSYTTTAFTEEPGDGSLEFRCRSPAEPCANTSAKYYGYCENGICCYNKLLDQEFCACYDPIYTGDRCDEHELQLLHASSSENMWIVIAVVVIVVLLISAVVVAVVCRRQRNRMRQENGGAQYTVTSPAPANDTAVKVLLDEKDGDDYNR